MRISSLASTSLVAVATMACRSSANGPRTDGLSMGPAHRGAKRLQGVIVPPDMATPEQLARWARQGYGAIAVTLDDGYPRNTYESAAANAAAASFDLYYWIEVGRNPTLAGAHPEWMASLGSHQDWRQRFPGVPPPKDGQVAKAFPWVPIGYREAFDAHLARVAKLRELAAGDYRGVLLNDLQGGPSSCGCGNLQCRWATDYQVPSTATRLSGNDVAARFITQVLQQARGKEVIPVWTTECEQEDSPAARSAHGTGYCGSVPCSTGACPKELSAQWAALVAAHEGPIGVLATHKELGRNPPGGDDPGWIAHAVTHLDAAATGRGQRVAHERYWLVVQGYDVSAGECDAARRAATETRAGGVFVALAPIDQSFQPRIVPAPVVAGPRKAVTWNRSEPEATRLARRTGKPLLIDFRADWCPSCREMETLVLTNPKIAARLAGFTLLKVDLTHADHDPSIDELTDKYGVDALPAIRVVSADGKVVAAMDGLADVSDILALLAKTSPR